MKKEWKAMCFDPLCELHNMSTEKASEQHHPSCTPNDRDLVWHCSQCGLNESAADIEDQLDAEREKVKVANTQCKTMAALMQDADKEAQQLREQLAAAVEALKWARNHIDPRKSPEAMTALEATNHIDAALAKIGGKA